LSAQKTAVGLSESDLYWGSNELEPYVAASLVVGTRGEVGGQFKADPTPWWPIRAFSPVTYTITLTVGTNGSGGDRILTKTNGVALTLEDSSEANSYFTRAGYRVTGWSTSDGGAQTHALSGAFTTDAATTLYPVWTINPPAPIVVYVAPTPVPYLRTLTPPKINFRDGKLVCTPGTYNTGYTLDGVVQGSTTSLFTPSTFTYNLLINGVTQASLSVTSSTATTTWNLPTSTSGSLLSCSVTVSANGVTNIDKSSDNTSATSSALTTQATSIATANADYSALLSANSKAYQKALVDNRATWRKQIDAIRSNYYDTLNRIKAKGGSKMIADKSTALKVMIAAQKKSAADYKASQPAAAAARDAANKAALATKTAAIAKANATYGTFIESIGYGVLIP
jgi:Skp family chaperone for outer membrane proteins